MDNTKKIYKNLLTGIVGQALTMFLGIVLPRFVLTSYGSEINGLLNSVTQIYSYVALLEAGIGTATVQALYRAIGKKNIKDINSILSATNRYYHRTGFLYLIAIVIFTVVYPLLVESTIPWYTIALVIIFNGLGSVINFFFQGKYMLLLQAEGKVYIQSTMNMCTNLFKNIAKIVLISQGFDVVFVQMIGMMVSLVQMAYITWYIKKNYKWINLKEKPDYKSLSQNKNVLVHQISTLVFNNTDTIILTAFCGLKVVSVYSMYTLLFHTISTALTTITSSFVFTLGQTYHVNKEKFIKLYDSFELYYMTLVFSLYTVVNFFILPFLSCYTKGVTDISYIDKYLPLLFISIYLLSCGRTAPAQAINVAGHFKNTQYRSILESVINIVVSLILVNVIGIYGVLCGTIAALLYRSNDMIIYANHKILNRSPIKTYKRWVINLVLFMIVFFVNQYLNFNLDSYFNIILYCIPYTLIVFIFFFGVVSLFEVDTAKFTFKLIKSNLAKKH